MTDTKDAAQVLRDAGWLVVEPGLFATIDEERGGPGGSEKVVTYRVYGVGMLDDHTETPDSIDWSHVDPKYRYMARDDGGDLWLYKERPEIDGSEWMGVGCHSTTVLSSCRRGTVPWDKSLVCREDEE